MASLALARSRVEELVVSTSWQATTNGESPSTCALEHRTICAAAGAFVKLCAGAGRAVSVARGAEAVVWDGAFRTTAHAGPVAGKLIVGALVTSRGISKTLRTRRVAC